MSQQSQQAPTETELARALDQAGIVVPGEMLTRLQHAYVALREDLDSLHAETGDLRPERGTT